MKKRKKKIIGLFSAFVLSTVFSIYTPSHIFAEQSTNELNLSTHPIGNINLKESEEDFKEDKEKATEWADEYFEEWDNSLTREQKRILINPVRLEALNEQLETFRGNEELMDDAIKTDMQNIDKALKNKDSKIDETKYVYKNLTDKELGYAEDSFYEEDSNKINREKYNEFKNNFKYGISNDFMLPNLSQTDGNKSQPILLRLKVPKGTSMGHVEGDKVILPRNQGIEITGISIIISKIDGREVVKVDGKIVPKEEITARITEAETTINDQFNKIANTNVKLVDLKIDGFYASTVAKRASILVDMLRNSTPMEPLIECIKEMNTNGTIILTDRNLKNFGEESDTTAGFYIPEDKQITLQINHDTFLNTTNFDSIALIHEFGHAFDYLLFFNISDRSLDFQNIFEKEKNNITINRYGIYSSNYNRYIASEIREFFAGIFSYMYSPIPEDREQLKKEAPEAYNYIENLINKLKKK